MKAFDRYYLQTACRRNIAFGSRIQSILQWFGIAVHNPWRDECCADFACCSPTGKERCWLSIPANKLPYRRVVWYEPTAPIGTPGRTFRKCTKIVRKSKSNN